MYARTKRVRHGRKTYEYVQIVESRRVDGKPRQRVVEPLGRLESKSPEEALTIANALVRFFEKRAGKAPGPGVVETEAARHFGDVAAIEDAWQSLGLDKIFERLAKDRRFDFPLERALFGMVAQRLIEPGSKLACVEWLEKDVYLPLPQKLDEDDLYATLTWLEEVTSAAEVRLFERLQRDGKCGATAFFYDTSATWFEGRGPEELAEFGRPKAGQPLERRIVLIGLVRTREGWPITHKVFAGDRADISTVKEIIDDLKTRFGVTQFVFVGDRGMVSDDVIAHLEKHSLQYVLAMRLRSTKEVRDEVLGRAGRFKVVRENLEVKEVIVEGRRYVVCRNPESVERDRRRRADILAKLEKALEGSVSVTSRRAAEIRANKAFARYLTIEGDRLAISDAKVEEDERYDGKWVIRSNIEDATSAALAETYKQLGGIEHDFRDLKSFIELRPVYHRREPRVRAHVFVCVLAKVIMTELERRLGAAGKRPFTVERALKLLGRVQATPLRVGARRLWVRSKPDEEAQAALTALGLGNLPASLGSEDLPA